MPLCSPQREPADVEPMAQPHTAQICKGTSESPHHCKHPLVPPSTALYQPFQCCHKQSRVGAASSPGDRQDQPAGTRTCYLKGHQRSQARHGFPDLPDPAQPRLQPSGCKLCKQNIPNAGSQMHPSWSSISLQPRRVPAVWRMLAQRSSAPAVINVCVRQQLKPPQPLPDTAPSCPACYLRLCEPSLGAPLPAGSTGCPLCPEGAPCITAKPAASASAALPFSCPVLPLSDAEPQTNFGAANETLLQVGGWVFSKVLSMVKGQL